jgi:hypothetical protein
LRLLCENVDFHEPKPIVATYPLKVALRHAAMQPLGVTTETWQADPNWTRTWGQNEQAWTLKGETLKL